MQDRKTYWVEVDVSPSCLLLLSFTGWPNGRKKRASGNKAPQGEGEILVTQSVRTTKEQSCTKKRSLKGEKRTNKIN